MTALSPPSAARDLFVSGGGGLTGQWVQRAPLEVLGRTVQGGTVQPGRSLEKERRGAPPLPRNMNWGEAAAPLSGDARKPRLAPILLREVFTIPMNSSPPPVGKSQAPRGDAGVGPVVTFDDQPPWRRRRWARPSAALANSSRNWPIKASPPRWKGGEPSRERRGVFRN